MKKPNLKFPKSRKKILFAVVIVLFLGTAGFIANQKKDTVSEQQNGGLIKKLDEVNRGNVTCQEVIDQIGDEPAEKYGNDARLKLLERQLVCYSYLREYSKSLIVANKLKTIYLDNNDQNNAARIDSIINDINNSKKVIEEDAKNVKPAEPIQ